MGWIIPVTARLKNVFPLIFERHRKYRWLLIAELILQYGGYCTKCKKQKSFLPEFSNCIFNSSSVSSSSVSSSFQLILPVPAMTFKDHMYPVLSPYHYCKHTYMHIICPLTIFAQILTAVFFLLSCF